MKPKKIVILLITVILVGILIFFIFFKNDMSKNLKIGNTSTSQEVVDYILNMNSYEATIQVEVQSNKNTNQYILKQTYTKPDVSTQEVLEPSNIAGVKMIREGQNLRIENSNLNLSTVFEKYEYISENDLDLNAFIEDYKKDENAKFKEENNQIIMKTNKSSSSAKNKTLYIDRNNGKPTKMEITDNNKNTTVYIVYSEVNVNGVK